MSSSARHFWPAVPDSAPHPITERIRQSVEMKQERSRLITIIGWLDSILSPEERGHLREWVDAIDLAVKSLGWAIKATDDGMPYAEESRRAALETVDYADACHADANSKLALMAIARAARCKCGGGP